MTDKILNVYVSFSILSVHVNNLYNYYIQIAKLLFYRNRRRCNFIYLI